MSAAVVLGTGVLNWRQRERVSDRYGTVCLLDKDDGDVLDVQLAESVTGTRGYLRAVVMETRISTHVGDMFHGFAPTTPAVGEVVALGSGTLFVEHDGYGATVGLRPSDGRERDWLQPQALYRVHSQTVRLEFVAEA